MDINKSNLFQIAFKEIKGLGNRRLLRIYSHFGNFERAFNSKIDEFKTLINDKKIITEILNQQNNKEDIIKKIDQIEKKLIANNIKFVSLNDKDYPNSLRNIDNPPVVLFLKGNLNLNSLERSLSIVGTRNPSAYGHSKARFIARELSEKNYIIISGLARGIDIEAHLGALEGGGKTVAVLGSGLEKIYPEEHLELAKDIVKEGLLISEVEMDQKVNKYSLIDRNRIISGLSKASLIIEGSKNSGTRYEANFAKNQKRLLFILRPKDENRDTSQLPAELRGNGAIEIEFASDILTRLDSADFNKVEDKSHLNNFRIIEDTTNYQIIEKDNEIDNDQLIKFNDWNSYPSNPFLYEILKTRDLKEIVLNTVKNLKKWYFMINIYKNNLSWRYYFNISFKDKYQMEIFITKDGLFVSKEIGNKYTLSDIKFQINRIKDSLWKYVLNEIILKDSDLTSNYRNYLRQK